MKNLWLESKDEVQKEKERNKEHIIQTLLKFNPKEQYRAENKEQLLNNIKRLYKRIDKLLADNNYNIPYIMLDQWEYNLLQADCLMSNPLSLPRVGTISSYIGIPIKVTKFYYDQYADLNEQ